MEIPHSIHLSNVREIKVGTGQKMEAAVRPKVTRTSSVATPILQKAATAQPSSETLRTRSVSQDSLQKEVINTKTREQRLVFNTLQKKNKKLKHQQKDINAMFKSIKPAKKRSWFKFNLFGKRREPKAAKVGQSRISQKSKTGKVKSSITLWKKPSFAMRIAGLFNREILKPKRTNRIENDIEYWIGKTDTFREKLFQKIANERAKEGKPLDAKSAKELKKLINKQKIEHLNETTILKAVKKANGNTEIAAAIHKEYSDSLEEIESLANITNKIHTLLESNPEDKALKETNFQLISLLRKAFQSKAYQALKECEESAVVHYLHEINLAMYTETNLLDAYVGSEQGKPFLGDQLVEGFEEKPLSETLQKARDHAATSRGLFTSHRSAAYAVAHPMQAIGAMQSRQWNRGALPGDYDPHGSLGNNSGALYEETVTFEDESTGRALDVRTPSPTIGDKVSPEFRAALQAIQNQRLAQLAGKKGYRRPNCWIYTNYQDITDPNEQGRSLAIMQLNTEFPLVFKGITLSKDSDYFTNGLGHKEGEQIWDGIDKEATFNADSIDRFVEEMAGHFTDDAHFTLRNRSSNKGHKLYFPAKTTADINNLKKFLQEVAKATGELLRDVIGENELEGKEAWQIKAAGKEFAYAAIQKYIQAKMLERFHKTGLDPFVITSSVCKEDIDRGFSDHVKRMYMLGAGEDLLLAKIINLPALMARYRLILNDRVQPLIAVTAHIPRDTAKKHLNLLTPEVTSTTATMRMKQS